MCCRRKANLKVYLYGPIPNQQRPTKITLKQVQPLKHGESIWSPNRARHDGVRKKKRKNETGL